MRPLISIVSPVYNEHECIERLLDEIEQFFEKQLADRFDLEVLFVDDGSTDGATEIIRRLAREHPHVRAVLLSRNFGKQAAISAAYRHACGDAVLTVDSDLQHPLEACLEMVARWEEGYDVVYGVRDSQPAGFIKTACSRGFYRVFNLFSPTKIVPRVADFRLLSRTAVNALNQLPERCRWSPGLVSWLGFRSAKVCYALRPRAAGEPKFKFFRSLALAITAFTSFSVAPLRCALLMGAVFMIISLFYLGYCCVDWLCGGTVVRGWTSLIALSVMTQGLTLIAFGIQSEYLAKIFLEVKRRPEYIVRELLGEPPRPRGPLQAPDPDGAGVPGPQ